MPEAKEAPLKAAAQKSRDGDFGPVQRISSAMAGRANQRARPSRPLRLCSVVELGPCRSLGANRSVRLTLVSYLIGLPYVKRSSTLRKAIGNQSDKMHVRRGIVTWPGDRGREIGAAARISTRLRGAGEPLLFLVATRSNICAGAAMVLYDRWNECNEASGLLLIM